MIALLDSISATDSERSGGGELSETLPFLMPYLDSEHKSRKTPGISFCVRDLSGFLPFTDLGISLFSWSSIPNK